MYIAFEGIDGCGKTTQIEMMKALNLSNIAYIKEPYYFNDAIKNLLINRRYASPAAHSLLFMAAHAELVAKWPKAQHVISDRSIYSSLAYTYGYNGNLAQKVRSIMKITNTLTYPDIVFYFKISIPVLESRLSRRKGKDKIESLSFSYYYRVQKFYNEASQEPGKSKWIVLDATKKPKALHKDIMKHLATEILGGNNI